MLDLEKARLIGKNIVVRPHWDWDSFGSITIPRHVLERYPKTGFVLNVGPDCAEGLQPGDFVLLDDDGTRISWEGMTVCQIELKDYGQIFVQEEIEAVIHEPITRYRNGGPDRQIVVQDLKGEGFSFLCSDVLSYGLGQLTERNQDLEYVPTIIIWHRQPDDYKVFPYYIIHEDNILAKLEW